MGPTRLTARQISRDHALAVAETGGAVGIWHFFPNLEKYVDGLKEMVDVVGIEHVCVGTDQQVAPGTLQDYSQWVHLVGALVDMYLGSVHVGNTGLAPAPFPVHGLG